MLDGSVVDAALYAQLSPDDVQLVRAALRDTDDEAAFDDEDGADVDDDPDASPDDDRQASPDDDRQEGEEEIVRLQGELDRSGRVQAALERYLDLL